VATGWAIFSYFIDSDSLGMLSESIEESIMVLWNEVYRCIEALRQACTRTRTYCWMVMAIACMLARPDLAGVTSFVRAGWLAERCYHRLLALFHTPALRLDVLTACWVKLVLSLFSPVTVNGYHVCVGDEIKIPKEGKKMPGVKKLHNSSDNNSKPSFIMGHSFQAISLLVQGAGGVVCAVPLLSRICQGVVFCNANRRSLLDKFVALFQEVCPLFDSPLLLVADAYYASGKIILPLQADGHHLVTRVRSNAVGYEPAPRPKIRRRGRPKLYGKKVKLRFIFKNPEKFSEATSPVYGEEQVILRYRSVELLWRPTRKLVRFVCVIHPNRGSIILMCTETNMDPLEIIGLYGLRFKIEFGFKQAIHTLGAYAYHFWMKAMTPINLRSGNQHMHRRPKWYRDAVLRKLGAYHRYVQLACVAQGLLQHLALNFGATVWHSFRSWLRTMKPHLPPSEMVVAMALRTGLPEYLRSADDSHILRKMIAENSDPARMPDWRMAA